MCTIQAYIICVIVARETDRLFEGVYNNIIQACVATISVGGGVVFARENICIRTRYFIETSLPRPSTSLAYTENDIAMLVSKTKRDVLLLCRLLYIISYYTASSIRFFSIVVILFRRCVRIHCIIIIILLCCR